MLKLTSKTNRSTAASAQATRDGKPQVRVLDTHELAAVSGGKILPPELGGPAGPRFPGSVDPRFI